MKKNKYVQKNKKIQARKRKKSIKKKERRKKYLRIKIIKKLVKDSEILEIYGNFNFLKNTEYVISEFIRIDGVFERSRNKAFYIDMSNVVNIDYMSILTLISKIKKYKIKIIKGNLPLEENSASLIKNSGYLDYFETNIKYKTLSVMYESRDFVDGRVLKKIIFETSEKLYGKKRNNKGMYRMCIELMQNTINHASEKNIKEKWWFHHSYNSNSNSYEFIFLDNGVGILESLKKQEYFIHEKIKNIFDMSQSFILEKILKGEIKKSKDRTSTGEEKRGKGLPTVLEAVKKESIKNVIIISNHTLASIIDGEHSEFKLLKKNFSGTLFRWEVYGLQD